MGRERTGPGRSAQGQLVPSAVVGRYTLIKKLGTGGMGEVWLARQEDVAGRRPVAIKRMLAHLAEDELARRMFLDEARIASQLNHPNIVQIYDVGALEGVYYIAMEYVFGENVGKIWRRHGEIKQPMPPALAARIVADVCKGLYHAHNRIGPDRRPMGIVHRDISPPNIMVNDDGEVKVLDFGIAKAAQRQVKTEAGALKGKLEYMSPEQVVGSEIDQRSDLFSLGIVLFELVTGGRLFTTSTAFNTLQAVRACKIPRPTALNPSIPAEIEAIILKALQREPEARYPNAGEFEDALEEFLRKQPRRVSNRDLAQHLQSLFQDRLEEKRRLVDSVHKREVSTVGMPPNARMPPPPIPEVKEVERGLPPPLPLRKDGKRPSAAAPPSLPDEEPPTPRPSPKVDTIPPPPGLSKPQIAAMQTVVPPKPGVSQPVAVPPPPPQPTSALAEVLRAREPRTDAAPPKPPTPAPVRFDPDATTPEVGAQQRTGNPAFKPQLIALDDGIELTPEPAQLGFSGTIGALEDELSEHRAPRLEKPKSKRLLPMAGGALLVGALLTVGIVESIRRADKSGEKVAAVPDPTPPAQAATPEPPKPEPAKPEPPKPEAAKPEPPKPEPPKPEPAVAAAPPPSAIAEPPKPEVKPEPAIVQSPPPAAAPPPRPAPRPAGASDGRMTIMVNRNGRPASLSVYVDGELKGQSPITVKAKQGLHLIEVRGAGMATVMRSVRLEAGEFERLELDAGGDEEAAPPPAAKPAPEQPEGEAPSPKKEEPQPEGEP